MARMIPHVDPRSLLHSSEAPVYTALRDQLSDAFTVLHSFPWLRPWRDQGALAEGETDFVVLHRRHRRLLFEVKGGRGIRHGGRRWYRSSSRGKTEFRDPFDQARRNMHALVDIVVERSGDWLGRHDFAYGYAVVFPHLDYEGEPPPHADRAIVISRRDLSFIDRAIWVAFRARGRHRRSPSMDKYDTLLHGCLMPKFRFIRRIGPDIASASEKLLEFTEQQAQVFEGLYTQDRVPVKGVSGSGKTFLALERENAFARAGRRTLFVCFKSTLAAWLRRHVQEDPRTSGHRPHLVIKTFHALAKQLVDSAGARRRFATGGQLTSHFWDIEVPELLDQAVLEHECRGADVRCDALVVDESQEFLESWWYTLTESLLRHKDSPVYAFMDPNQSLRGEAQSPPIDFRTTCRLSMNCRNTRKITTASASLLGFGSRSFTRSPLGAALRVLRARSAAQQKELVTGGLRRLLSMRNLLPQQVVPNSPSTKATGSISDVTDVNGVQLTTDGDAWRDGRAVLVTTSRSFKGLEADGALLYDLVGFGSLFQRRDLYVACTRAKFPLIAITHGNECRKALESASRAAELET